MNRNRKNAGEEMVYKTPITLRDYKHTLWNLLVYGYICVMWMYLSSVYYNFGKYIISTAVAVTIAVSAAVAIALPSQRDEVIKDMKKMLFLYLTALFGYRYIAMLLAGVSSEDLSAALNTALPGTSGTAMLGWLQTILWIAAIATPVGFIGMQLKKIGQYYGTKRKSQAASEIRDIRNKDGSHVSLDKHKR